jgi:hypothetical protein
MRAVPHDLVQHGSTQHDLVQHDADDKEFQS